MSGPELPDLPPDISALLRAEREPAAVPESDRRRVAARLTATTGLAFTTSALAHGTLASPLVKFISVALLVTGAAGVVVHRARTSKHPTPAVTTPSPRATVSATPSRPVVVAPVSAPAATPPVERPPAPTPAPRVRSAPRNEATDDTSLEDERTQLLDARQALARGEASHAIEALDAHARRHPDGRLIEEREALRVRALAASGDLDRARAARDRFHQRFPASVLGDAVDRAVPVPEN